MSAIVEQLDHLLDQLEQSLNEGRTVQQTAAIEKSGDAIDRILNSPARQTEVVNLHEQEDIQQFRQDLINGLVRLDRLNIVLGLISQLVGYLTRR